jgi:hypothetical protein
MCTHYQVVIKELGRALAVGADPAYMGGKMDDHIRAGGIQYAPDIIESHQIVFFYRGHEYVGRPVLA